MNRLIATACTLAIVGLAACSPKSGDSSGSTKGPVATVDGVAISRSVYDEYVKGVSSTPQDKLEESQRTGLLENLIRAQLLSKVAEKEGVANQESTKAILELHHWNVLSQALSEKFMKDHPVTDDELRAEYGRQVDAMDKVQVRASHVLVKTEDEAKKIIEQLKAGGNFAQIAKAQSLDTVSKEKGGDLDWFSPGSMVPEFSNAIRALKKGETSTTPVQTQYGWHVLRVTDTREAAPPAFESVKTRLEELVQGRKFKEYVDGLLAKSKITRSL